MRFTRSFFTTAFILFACVQITAPAYADNVGAITAKPETQATATSVISGFGEQISDADLSTYRGGTALQISEMNLNSNLNNNQAIDNITGNNIVTQDAFSGSSGFSTVVQNSGNNVIIQNATILNLSLH